jgi:glycosyltransferase involved in cell wall biosynthesis
VDLRSFTLRAPGEPAEFSFAYCGSLGGWYMTEEMVGFAREARSVLPGPVLVLTPDVELARRVGFDPTWAEVRNVTHAEVPVLLRRARASFFLIRPTPAKKASLPTKVAEALACGLPIVANAGVGHLDTFLEQRRVGVLVRSFGVSSYREAAERLNVLLGDPGTAPRCRQLAEECFGLDAAVKAYRDLYATLVIGRPTSASGTY